MPVKAKLKNGVEFDVYAHIILDNGLEAYITEMSDESGVGIAYTCGSPMCLQGKFSAFAIDEYMPNIVNYTESISHNPESEHYLLPPIGAIWQPSECQR